MFFLFLANHLEYLYSEMLWIFLQFLYWFLEQILNTSCSFNMVIHSIGALPVMDTMTMWSSYLLAWPYISELFTGIPAVYWLKKK